MTFAAPAALWALTTLLVLILFSLWRLRPARVVVPSVALWLRLPPAVPPVRALRRPRWSLLLLLQAAAVAALVAGLATPLMVEMKPAPRKLAVVVDLGVRAREFVPELARIVQATSHDDAVMYETPLFRRGPIRVDVEQVDYAGDPAIALKAAASEGRRVIWIGDLPVAADANVLTGGPSSNVGITDLAIDADGMFIRLLNLGAERDLQVRINDRSETWRVAAGDTTRTLPLPDAERVEIELPPDDFPVDNRAVAVRSGALNVELRGRAHPLLRRALEVQQPSARIVDRGGALIVALGEIAEGDGVFIDPPGEGGIDAAAFSLADHPLARGMKAADLRLKDVRPLPADFTAIAFADGKPVIGLRNRTIAVSASLGDWPLTPSFPIFFANVVTWARAGTGLWTVMRTGPDHPRAGGDVAVLDPAASALGRERRAFDPAMLGDAPLEPVGRDLTPWVLAAAAILVIAAWSRESRGG